MLLSCPGQLSSLSRGLSVFFFLFLPHSPHSLPSLGLDDLLDVSLLPIFLRLIRIERCKMDRGPWLTSPMALFMVWSILTFIVRSWAKLRTKNWAWDDWVITAALVGRPPLDNAQENTPKEKKNSNTLILIGGCVGSRYYHILRHSAWLRAPSVRSITIGNQPCGQSKWTNSITTPSGKKKSWY